MITNKKTIRCDSMIVGGVYGISFYDEKGVVRRTKLLARPAHHVKDMTKDDRYIVEIDGKPVEMFRNACAPHYLETRRIGTSGRLRNIRMTFYDIGVDNSVLPCMALVVVPQPVKQRGNENRAVTPDVICLSGPVAVVHEIRKPNRADFDTKGKYDHAMKKWKKEIAG